VSLEPERRRPPGRGRGVLLAASVAVFILIGGGAALWSLLREIYAAPALQQGPIPTAAIPSPSPATTALPQDSAAEERPPQI
jgi:hypothetical protein